MGMGTKAGENRAEVLLRTGERATHTPTAREARQAGNIVQRAAQAEWEAAHQGEDFDPEWFKTTLLPELASKSLTAIAKATGRSTKAAGKVRSGKRVPHPRHWKALGALTSVGFSLSHQIRSAKPGLLKRSQ
jgi:hypothetical protein